MEAFLAEVINIRNTGYQNISIVMRRIDLQARQYSRPMVLHDVVLYKLQYDSLSFRTWQRVCRPRLCSPRGQVHPNVP